MVVSVTAISVANGFTVTFRCAPAASWSISVVQLAKPHVVGIVTSSGAQTWTTQVLRTPSGVVAGVAAHVAACDAALKCYPSNAVTVGP